MFHLLDAIWMRHLLLFGKKTNNDAIAILISTLHGLSCLSFETQYKSVSHSTTSFRLKKQQLFDFDINWSWFLQLCNKSEEHHQHRSEERGEQRDCSPEGGLTSVMFSWTLTQEWLSNSHLFFAFWQMIVKLKSGQTLEDGEDVWRVCCVTLSVIVYDS